MARNSNYSDDSYYYAYDYGRMIFTSGDLSHVAEGTPPGTIDYVAQAYVTRHPYALIQFRLTPFGTNDNALFNIDRYTGAVTFKFTPNYASPQDFDHDGGYVVTITAFDGHGHKSIKSVLIVVDPANLRAPVFDSSATASAPENVSPATPVYVAHATDSDSAPVYNTVTYSLAPNAGDNNLFNINSSTGAVTFKASPNYENPQDQGHDNTYNIVISASDGTNVATQAVAISVTDVNDNVPMFTSDATATAPENVTTTVYTAHATDADGTAANNTVRYSLAGAGVDNGLFNIDAVTGAVTFKTPPDFENPADNGRNNVYDITVRASDGTNSVDKAVAITVTNLNEAPAGADKTVTTQEDAAYTFTASDFGFSDPSDAPAANTLQAVIITTLPAAGTGTLMLGNSAVTMGQSIAAADIPNLTFMPASNANGTPEASFTFQVQDNGGTANGGQNTDPTPNTIFITVTPVNDAPTATGLTQPLTIDEDAAATNLFGTAPIVSDIDSPTLTATLTLADPNAGVLTGATASGTPGVYTITGTPANVSTQLAAVQFDSADNYNGSTSVTVAITDSQSGPQGTNPSGTVSITVNPVNDAPTATGLTQSLTIDEDAAATNLFMTAPTVSDVDSQTVAATLTLDASAGVLTGAGAGVTAGGTTTYTITGTPANVSTQLAAVQFDSADNYNGSTSVTVAISDGQSGPQGTNPGGTVSITVNPVNDAPTATNLTQPLTIDEDAAATNLFTVAPTVSDIDSPAVSATLLLSDAAAGVLTGAGAGATAGGATTYTITGTPAYVQTALAAVQFNSADNYNGSTSVIVSISDGNNGPQGTNPSGTVSITVNPVNDAPTATNLTQPLTIDEDAAATNLFLMAPNVSDVDSPAVTATLTLDASAGVLTGAGAAITAGGVTTYTITGTPANVSTQLAAVQFDAADNYNGSTSVTVAITDGNNGPQGTNPIGSVSITVNPVNDAPTATGLTQSLTIDEDAAATNLFMTAPTVADVDSPTLTATLKLTNPNAGVLTGATASFPAGVYTITGSPADVQTALAGVKFDSADNYNGTTNVVVTISDDNNDPTGGPQGMNPSGTVSITVNPVNDAPTATNLTQPLTIDEDAAAKNLFTTAPTVSDVDSPTLTATLTLTNAAAGVLTGAGAGVTAGGATTYTFTGTPDDVQTQLAAVQFDSADNYNGMTNVTVAISDGDNGPQGTDPIGSVSITVNPVNDAPTATNLTQPLTIDEDAAAKNLFTTAPIVSDIDNPTLTATLTLTDAAAGVLTGAGAGTTAGGVTTYTITGTPANVSTQLAAVQFDSADNYNGSTSVTVAITDGQSGPQGTNPSGTVSITVNPVNDAPTATGLTQSLTIDEDAAATNLFMTAPTVSDVDSQTVAATLTLDASAGVLTGAGAGVTAGGTTTYTITGSSANVGTQLAAVQFDSADNYNGTTSVTVAISDGQSGPQGTNPSGTVSITVNPVNDAPTATNLTQPLTIDEDAAAKNLFTTAPTVSDVDSPTLTATLTLTNAAAGVLTGAGAGVTAGGATTYTFTGTPDDVQTQLAAVQFDSADNYNGMTNVTVAISDGQSGPQGTNPSGSVSITVNPVNDAPTLAATGGSRAYSPGVDLFSNVSVSTGPADESGQMLDQLVLQVTNVSPASGEYLTIDGTRVDLTNGNSVTTGTLGVTASVFFSGGTATVTIEKAGGITASQTAGLVDGLAYTDPAPAGNETARVVTVTSLHDTGGTDNNGTPTSMPNISSIVSFNDPPVIAGGDTANVAVEENTTTVTVVHATDPDNGPSSITYSIVTGAGSPDADKFTINSYFGSLDFIAPPDYETPASAAGSNTYTVQVAASDGAGTDIQTITVTVTDVNEAPTIISNGGAATASINVDENQTAVTTVVASDPDRPAQTLTYSIVGGADATKFTIDANGVLSFVTAPNFEAPTDATTDNTYDVTVRVTDSGNPAQHDDQAIAVHVQNVNEAPTNMVPAATQTTAEDAPKRIMGVSVADVDSTNLTTTLHVDHGTIVVANSAAVANNATATVTITGTATQINTALAGLAYINTRDYNGSDTLTVSTSDGSLTDTDTVAINVTPVQDANNDTATATTATLKNIDVNANDTFENAGHMITAISGASITTGGTVATTHGSVTLLADGTLNYTSAAGYTGHDVFSYTVSSGGVTETASVDVTVNPPNAPPTATNATAAGDEDAASIPVTLSATDTDAGDSVASYKLTSLPSNGTLYLGDGTTLAQTNTAYTSNSFAFKPAASYSGTTSFQFTATDTHGATSNTATETIDVRPVADGADLAKFDLTPTGGAEASTTPVPNNAYVKQDMSVVSDFSGGYIVAYTASGRAEDQGDSIAAQRFDYSGSKIGSEILLTDGLKTLLLNQAPDIHKLPNGGALLVYQNDGNNAPSDIYGVLIGADGTVTKSQFLLDNEGPTYQLNPSTAVFSDGSFVLVDTHGAKTSSPSQDVYFKLFNADGTQKGAAQIAHDASATAQFQPEVAVLKDGSFVVTWTNDVDTNTTDGVYSYDIRAQRFSDAGARLGGVISVNTTIAGDQTQPDVVALSGGGYAIVWIDGPSIVGRIFDANGNGGAEITIGAGVRPPSITSLPDGGFLASWDRSPVANDSNVVAQRVSAAGALVGDQFFITNASGNQSEGDEGLALLGNGDVVATYYTAGGAATVQSKVFDVPGDGRTGTATTLTTLNATLHESGETLSYHLTGYTAGTTFNFGSAVSGTEWVISSTADINALKTIALTANAPTPGAFTLIIDAQTTDSATLSTGTVTSAPSDTIQTIRVGIRAPGDPVFAAHDSGPFDLHLSKIADTSTAHVDTLPDNGHVTYADGSAVTAGATLSAHDLAGLKFTPTDTTTDHAANFIYTVSDGKSVTTETLPINVQHGSNLTLTGTAEKDVIVGGAGHDVLNGAGGGNYLTGAGGADSFVFDTKALADANGAAKFLDHVTDYSAAQGDTIDFTKLFAATPNPSAHAAELVHVTEDVSGHAATVAVNVAGPNAAAHWVEIAHLDGVQAGAAVDIALDAAQPQQFSHFHAEALAHA